MSHQNNDFQDKLLLDISKTVAEVQVIQSRIETGLNDHIRRTYNLEGKVENLNRIVWMGAGSLALLSIAATVIAILKFFK